MDSKQMDSKQIDAKQMALYDPKLMKSYREAQHRGELENATFVSDVKNPSCGDHVIFAGIVQNGVLMTLKFSGDGSMLSQAFAERLCNHVIGKSVPEIMALGEVEAKNILEIELGPTRLKTVYWVLTVLQKGISNHA
ncbi:TPA: hypothetical protein DDZ86_04820 [Candidatus Dependentiae bacterium]|nr:MAG: hypothetical protein A2Y17_09625 [Clostridiales bacterium GWF2_38_85]HBL98935.1 hypothetical protein [Candidatus Dependentiae bacterium]